MGISMSLFKSGEICVFIAFCLKLESVRFDDI